MVKLNVDIDENSRVNGWGFASADSKVGSVNNGLTVVEVSDVSQVVDGHSYFVNGTIKLDDDYIPFDQPPTVVTPSAEHLVINQLGLTISELQKQVKELGGND
jgi:hypothetical protein